MDGPYPPPTFAASIYERQFRRFSERFGPSLHDIVSSHGSCSDDDIWSALNSVVYWKTERNEDLTKSQWMVAACAEFYMAVNSSGFQRYFETRAGNAWPSIYEILQLGGDSTGPTAFSKVLDVFPKGKPSTHLEHRLDQLDSSKMSPQVNLAEVFRRHDDIRCTLDYPSNETVWRALLAQPDERYIPRVPRR